MYLSVEITHLTTGVYLDLHMYCIEAGSPFELVWGSSVSASCTCYDHRQAATPTWLFTWIPGMQILDLTHVLQAQ